MSDPPLGPRGLPGLRAHLLHDWQPGRPFSEGFAQRREMTAFRDQGVSAEESIRRVGEWERETLTHASLWWVGDEMTDLLDAAAPTIPPVRLAPEVMPHLAGLVRFAHPLSGLDAERASHLTVDAMHWGPIKLPPRPGESRRVSAIAIASYRRTSAELVRADHEARLARGEETLTEHQMSQLAERGPTWVPLGRADWVLGSMPDDWSYQKPGNEADELAHASQVEDRRRLLTLWVLSSQPGVASRSVDLGDRAERRRAERAKLPPPEVTVINLRRPVRPTSGEGATVEWSRRWWVGWPDGKWRQQAYGPGRSLRRPIWIAPYVKGPGDKPLVMPEQVRSWTR